MYPRWEGVVPMKRCVVLVDDDEDFLLLWRLVLGGDPRFPCVEAMSDPVEALERIGVLRPAVLVTDMYMPGMTGLDLLHNVRIRFPSTAVIVTSAVPDVEVAATRAGAAAFLDKSDDAIHRLPVLLLGVLDAEPVAHLPPAGRSAITSARRS
jgi:FixJ family two-component response regulator